VVADASSESIKPLHSPPPCTGTSKVPSPWRSPSAGNGPEQARRTTRHLPPPPPRLPRRASKW
jgi:hypothetical protein